MVKTFIGVREVDKKIFHKFRTKALEKKMKLGNAITFAMKIWIEDQDRINKKNQAALLKPFSFGNGTEKLSTEIDGILYT